MHKKHFRMGKLAILTGVVVIGISAYIWLIVLAPPIVGDWKGDMNKTMNRLYGKHGISVKDATTVVTFCRNGTWTSEDFATFVAIVGDKKGSSVKYHNKCRGTFTFNGIKGTAYVVDSNPTVDGRPLKLQMPESISMNLKKNNSILEITENYKSTDYLRYYLKRN